MDALIDMVWVCILYAFAFGAVVACVAWFAAEKTKDEANDAS